MMAVFSTMPDNGIFSPGIELLPHGNFVENFNNLQRDTDFVGAIGISVSVAVTYTFLSVLLTSMAGWALARYQFFGKGVVVAIILGTITLPYAVVRDPAIHHGGARLQARQHLGGADRAAAVQFARRAVHAPELFDDAGTSCSTPRASRASRNGASSCYVALPLARPTLAALAIILFLASWNNYLWPLLINCQARRR